MKRAETRAESHRTLADRELDVVTGGVLTAVLATVGGDTEVTWTPRAYAVQSDLSGGVTGAHAGLYDRRRP
jgi:hypothetical protein